MQQATAPTWDPNSSNSVIAQAVIPNSHHFYNRQLIVIVISLTLYVGIMIVGFYLGVCWIQNSLGELNLSVRELKNQISLVVLKQQNQS